MQNTRQKGENVFGEAINIAEFTRLLNAHIVLTFVCHISVRLFVMPCDEPMALYAANSTVTYVTNTVHVQCV